MNKRLIIIAALAGAILGGQGAAWAQSSADHFRLEATETPLKPMANGFIASTWAVSPDRNHIAYEVERGHQWFVVVDGREGRAYDAFLRGSKPIWDGPHSLHDLVRRGDAHLRLQETDHPGVRGSRCKK
ncbi:MAG TPA: hypothetical protein VMV40_00665 [Acidiferrobacter sp.]|nr:hypothetical protein [Acidiferrobacter sp.]